MKVFVTNRGGELAGTRTGWRREELEAIGLGIHSFRTPMDQLKNPRRWRASCSTRARPSLESSQVVQRA